MPQILAGISNIDLMNILIDLLMAEDEDHLPPFFEEMSACQGLAPLSLPTLHKAKILVRKRLSAVQQSQICHPGILSSHFLVEKKGQPLT